jgi:hypothetical protein
LYPFNSSSYNKILVSNNNNENSTIGAEGVVYRTTNFSVTVSFKELPDVVESNSIFSLHM